MNEKLHSALIELEKSLTELDKARELLEKSDEGVLEIKESAKETILKTLTAAENLERQFNAWIKEVKKDSGGIIKELDKSLKTFETQNVDLGKKSASLTKSMESFIKALEDFKITVKLTSIESKTDEVIDYKLPKKFQDVNDLIGTIIAYDLPEKLSVIKDVCDAIDKAQKNNVANILESLKNSTNEISNLVNEHSEASKKRINKFQVINSVLLGFIIIWLVLQKFFF